MAGRSSRGAVVADGTAGFLGAHGSGGLDPGASSRVRGAG